MNLIIACLLLLAALVLALMSGDRAIPAAAILPALLARPEAAPDVVFILRELRLPRAILAMLTGAALSLAGAICQAAMRNPLAEPGLIGVNGGAALAAMILLVALPGISVGWLPWAAFAGAAVMVAVIQGLALRVGMRSQRIILIGIGCSAFAGGIAGFLSVFGEVTAVQRAMIWMAGSLQDARWSKTGVLLAWLIVPVALIFAGARLLDMLALEDTVLRALGLHPALARGGALVLCAALAGAAVAATGPVSFVGLIAPHIARRLGGPGMAREWPMTAVCGALLLLIADTLGRSLIAPAQIPAGIVTALLGAPFFGWLIWRARND